MKFHQSITTRMQWIRSAFLRSEAMSLLKQICLNGLLAGALLLFPFNGTRAGESVSKSAESAENLQAADTAMQSVLLANTQIPLQEEVQYLTASQLAEEENLTAILWVQRSAEFRGLSYQAYNLATMEVDKAVAQRREEDKALQKAIEKDSRKQICLRPLAVVLDIDDTIVSHAPLEVYYLEHPEAKANYNAWKQWISQYNPLLPGARDFLKYADKRGVQIFYVTGRGPQDKDITACFLQTAGLPFKDANHLLMNDRSGSKMNHFAKLARRYDIICYLGDNVADFPIGASRDENAVIYKKESAAATKTEIPLDIQAMLKHDKNAKRNRIIDLHKHSFGTKFILLPNPMYGDWENNLAKKFRRLPGSQQIALRKAALKSFKVKEKR